MTKLEEELVRMDSFIAINDVLDTVTLHPRQCIDVLKALAVKKSIIIYDTGTGKTLIAAAWMKLLLKEDPSRRFIFFCKKDQLIQTPKKLEKFLGILILASAADAKSVQRVLTEDVFRYRVIMLTHDCLFVKSVLDRLYGIRDSISGIIIDEAHELNNTKSAASAEMLKAIVSQFEWVLALTATPIRTDVRQLARLANLVNEKRYPNARKLLKELENGRFGVNDDPCFFINRSAEELGRVSKPRGFVVWCTPLAHQKIEQRGGVALMQVCKGEGATVQVKALIDLIESKQGQRGLVYISEGVIYAWVEKWLRQTSIKYRVIRGETGTAERAEIMDSFNNGDSIDVVLLSVTTAIDLDCDYVVFYEFTSDVEQMIGRAHRGLQNKELDVYFIITKGTKEVEYFVNNVLARCDLIKQILGKGNSAVEEIGKEVGMVG